MEHRATQGRVMKAEALKRFDAIVAAPFGAVGIRTEGVGTEDECVAEIVYLPPGVAAVAPKNRLAAEASAQIRRYLDDPSQPFALPLKPVGTRYQRRVWEKIAGIPSGQVRSYGEVARALHSGPRAVGQACGANYFPLAIPCHRVVASAGIGGFARGDDGFHLAIKRWLLAHEGTDLAQ
ncbi:MAG TPA: methylated-DNA--[protein]-cysteine S-methyltransferase [Burkholderiales bacterium]|nr:methylated-DNA--[protein]-cysteine S-methyltransferase [Burkholderiales bacterium]